jgi:hypothetical protein
MFAITFDGAGAALHLLAMSLDGYALVGMERGASLVAGDAQQHHTFTNRTGKLERNILPRRPRGLLLNDTLSVEVVGARPYGSYVEDGTSRNRPYPYLKPAWDRTEDAFAAEMDLALQEAVRAAGW